MPLDPSAILDIKQPPSPLSSLYQLENLRSLQQERQSLAQERQFKAQQLQQAMEAQQRANQVVASAPRNADGTFDTGALLQSLAGAGLPLEHQEKLTTSIDNLNKVITSFNQQKRDHQADLANVLLQGHDASDPVSADSIHLGMAAAKTAGLASDDDEQRFTQALGQGADPRQLLTAIRGMGSKWAAPEKFVNVPEGGALVGETSGRVLYQGAPKPPTAEADNARAIGLLARQNQGETLAPPEVAWLKAYQQQRLQGPEASAAAAADRQATAITAAAERQARSVDAQTAAEGRRETFQEQQAGRREYTDKVATPYQTALASAQTLRDTVAAAKSGNKVAANLQALETAMSAIRSQGLNRINMTEIGVAGDAGSLWDSVQSAFGKITSGQPVDASLQKDMLDFANILEKSATVKYQKGRQSLQQTYKGLQVPDESVTAPTSAPTARDPLGIR